MVERISKSLYDAAISQNSSLTPTKLRPVPEKEDEFFEEASDGEMNSSLGYGILQFEKLPTLFNTFYSIHCTETDCQSLNIDIFSVSHKGLCVELQLVCKNCYKKSQYFKMYEDVNTKIHNYGPKPGSLNVALGLCILKTKVGISDLRFILSCLDIKPPSKSTLQRLVNSLPQKVMKINEASMVENQKFVKLITELRGDSPNFDVETDVSYNNRLQLGFQAGTQSFAPLVEKTTNKKLVINCQIANKLESCTKNVEQHENLTNQEKFMIAKNVKEVNKHNILTVSSITTDGCSQLDNVTDMITSTNSYVQPRHFTCFVHKMRRVYKNVRSLPLKLPEYHSDLRDSFKKKLAICTRNRVTREFTRLKAVPSQTLISCHVQF